jgi:hypothetical protein
MAGRTRVQVLWADCARPSMRPYTELAYRKPKLNGADIPESKVMV